MEELDRMLAIGSITTKNKEGTIVFEKIVDDVQPTRLLEQVWVTVTRDASSFSSSVGSGIYHWGHTKGGYGTSSGDWSGPHSSSGR